MRISRRSDYYYYYYYYYYYNHYFYLEAQRAAGELALKARPVEVLPPLGRPRVGLDLVRVRVRVRVRVKVRAKARARLKARVRVGLDLIRVRVRVRVTGVASSWPQGAQGEEEPSRAAPRCGGRAHGRAR